MSESPKPGPEAQWQRILGRCNERVEHLEALCRVAGEVLSATGGPASITKALSAAAEGGIFAPDDIEALRAVSAREAEADLQRHARERQHMAQQAATVERLTTSLAAEVDRRVRAEIETSGAHAKAERATAYATHWRARTAQADQARTVALQALRDLVHEITRRLPGAAKTSMFRKALIVLDGNPAPTTNPEADALALLAEAVSGKVEAWDEWFRRADRVVEASQARATALAEERTAGAASTSAVDAVTSASPATIPSGGTTAPTPDELAALAREAEFDQHLRIDDRLGRLRERGGRDADHDNPGQQASNGKPAAR